MSERTQWQPRGPLERDAPCEDRWPGRTDRSCVLPFNHDVHWDGNGNTWHLQGLLDEEIAAAERRGYERAIEILRAVNWGDAADYLAKHPDRATKETTL